MYQSLLEKAERELSSLSLDKLLVFLLLLLLPTQLGKHFWPNFSYVEGIRIDYLSPTLYLTDLIFVLLFLKNYKEIKLEKANPYILFLISLVSLGILISQNPLSGIYFLAKIFEMSFIAVYFYKHVSIDFLTRVLSIGLVFESLIALLQFINKGSLNLFYFLGERTFDSQTPNIANAVIDGNLILRPYATFPHPNVLAGFLLTVILLIILIVKPKTNFEKVYFNLCLFLGSATLALTLSRVPIILFVILIPLLLIKTKRYLSLLLMEAFCLVLLIPYLARFTPSLFDSSLVERGNQVMASLSMIKDHPVFGVGLNNFLNSLPLYYQENTNYFFLQPVHNIYLLVVSQIGIIASLIVGYYCLKLIKAVKLEKRIILLALLFLGLFDHYLLTLQQGQLLLAVLVGVSLRRD